MNEDIEAPSTRGKLLAVAIAGALLWFTRKPRARAGDTGSAPDAAPAAPAAGADASQPAAAPTGQGAAPAPSAAI